MTLLCALSREKAFQPDSKGRNVVVGEANTIVKIALLQNLFGA